MAAGFIYDRLGESKQGQQPLRAGRAAREEQPGRAATTWRCISAAAATTSAARSTCWRRRRARSIAHPAVAYTNAGRCAAADARPTGCGKVFPQGAGHQPEAGRRAAADGRTHAEGRQRTAGPRVPRALRRRWLLPARRHLWLGRTIELGLGDTEQAAALLAAASRMSFRMSTEAGLLVGRGAPAGHDADRCSRSPSCPRARAHASGVNARRAA